jgi:NADH:ubiquinone oxidoreductase subunit K
MILLAYELATIGLVFGYVYLSFYFSDGCGYIVALVILAISGGVELPIGLSLVIRYFDLFKTTKMERLFRFFK